MTDQIGCLTPIIQTVQENYYMQEVRKKLVITVATSMIENPVPQPYMQLQTYMGSCYPHMNQTPPAVHAMCHNYTVGEQHQSDGYFMPPQP